MSDAVKNPVGRPPWIPTEEILRKVEEYGELGLTKENLARCLGIDYMTLNRKEKEFSAFRDAIKNGAARGLAKVAKDLILNSAKGNPVAQIFYLKCRSKGQWNDDENLRLLEKRIARMEKKQKLDDHKESDDVDNQTEKDHTKEIQAPGSTCT